MEQDWRGIGNCSSTALDQFHQMMNPQMVTQVNGLTIVIVIFVVILVGIGLFMPHYRHRSFIRFFFLGATNLYLPILSYIISNGSTIASTLSKLQKTIFSEITSGNSYEIMFLICDADIHLRLIILWVALAQIIGINTSTMVAADDREHRNNGLPTELLAKALWTSYLAVDIGASDSSGIFSLVFAKIVLKCFALWMARHSLAHGRNPRFIVGYMMQLDRRSHNVAPTGQRQTMTTDELPQDESQKVILTVEQQVQKTDGKLLPPPLVVMEDERQKVEKQPQGYCIKTVPSQDYMTMVNKSLVTIEKVWNLDDNLMGSVARIKDVCFSFALFKLLRCRFAGYTVAEAGFKQTHNFFWYEFLKDSGDEFLNDSGADRVFSVMEDELSFLHDYYYTSLPSSYSKSWLPGLSIVISLVVIQYCLFTAWMIFMLANSRDQIEAGQISCLLWCSDPSRAKSIQDKDRAPVEMGSLYFDVVLVYLLLALVVLAEVRDIGSYIFSNWTNVALICRHVAKHDTKQTPPIIHRWVSTMSGLRYRLMKHRMVKMNQCSVLVLHQRYHPTVLLTHLLILFRLGDRSKKVKVPPVVKYEIITTLRANNGVKISGEAFLPRRVQEGGSAYFIWDCSDKGVAHTILICHIATGLLEMRQPRAAPSDDEITATHLSRYCAYLVSHMPVLLPDDDRWCKSLYKAVKKNSLHLLSCDVSGYDALVPLLSEPEAHEVLQKGAYLARDSRLVKEDGSTAWVVLAEFWTEMILHVASSGKPNNHAEAIAGGTELITLLWALVMHAGPCPATATDPAAPATAPAAPAPSTVTDSASPAPTTAAAPVHATATDPVAHAPETTPTAPAAATTPAPATATAPTATTAPAAPALATAPASPASATVPAHEPTTVAPFDGIEVVIRH